MTVIAMSRAEIDRVHVLTDLLADRITAVGAAQIMGITPRQVFRLAKAFRELGPSGLVSRRRGKPSNRSYPAGLRAEALGLIASHYADFGPTLACEKLAERHGVHLGVETVRQWMLAAGLWTDRRQRRKPVHQPRHRRDCLGELVQIDGSEHWWFEDRGPQCTLLVFIDDATSRLMHLRFVPSESTFDYFEAMRATATPSTPCCRPAPNGRRAASWSNSWRWPMSEAVKPSSACGSPRIWRRGICPTWPPYARPSHRTQPVSRT